MPSNYTENYRLNQWEAGDKVLRTDFNADNAKIDKALAAKADASTLEAFSRTVAEHASALPKLGNCQIWTGSYVGDGTCGKDHPTSFTFPKKPVLAMIEIGNGQLGWILPRNGWFATPALNWLSWSGSTASWYASVSKPEPGQQMNVEGSTYWITALMAMDE